MNYFNNCVNWDPDDVDEEGGLSDMVASGREITRRTFLKHVHRDSLREVESDLGYPAWRGPAMRPLTIVRDYHVRYHKGKLHGQWVVWLTHSAVEYVFKP